MKEVNLNSLFEGAVAHAWGGAVTIGPHRRGGRSWLTSRWT